jgi:hypothetical protein
MDVLFTCEECGVAVDNDNIGCLENNWCDQCMDAWCEAQIKFWRPIWRAEKAAGIHLSRKEYQAQLRDAGRGHLVRDEDMGDF